MRNLILKKTSENYLPGKRALKGLNLLLKFVLKKIHGRALKGVRDYKRVKSLSELYQIPLDLI
jgi:hypothetical protein